MTYIQQICKHVLVFYVVAYIENVHSTFRIQFGILSQVFYTYSTPIFQVLTYSMYFTNIYHFKKVYNFLKFFFFKRTLNIKKFLTYFTSILNII